MGLRLPQADVDFKNLTNTDLAKYAQTVHDLMTENDAIFDTPPVSMAALQSSINAYKAALAAAIKGSKAQTAAKNSAKESLKLILKQLAGYVNTIVVSSNAGGSVTNLTALRSLVSLSGFKISKDPLPVANNTGLEIPIIKIAESVETGKLHLLLRQYTKAKAGTFMWQVAVRTSAVPGTPGTPAGPWQYYQLTNGNINIEALTSGISYDYQVAAVGGRDVKTNQFRPVNYTEIRSLYII